MIYDKLPVALLSLLAAEDADSANARIANYLLNHASAGQDLSIKSLATACHVGVGTVSRFVREAGFEDFAELRETFKNAQNGFERTAGNDAPSRTVALARAIGGSIARVAKSIDHNTLARLVNDLRSYEEIGIYGLLKAQAAAIDLQVDLLTLGKFADTCTLLADQAQRIATAGPNKLIVLFSYTGAYFDAVNVADALRRPDRPRIWMVCGEARPLPPFVHDRLLFSSDHSRLGHPYQLEYVAGLIAQEYAATL